MKFSIGLTASAIEDIDYYRKKERRIISDGIALFLTHDANIETKRRKPMRPNQIAQWELHLADFRVFYDFEQDDVVKVVALGHKEHNDLYIRGSKVEL